MRGFNIDNAIAAGVDDGGAAEFGFPFIIQCIAMRMSMNEIAGMIHVNQAQKGAEPPMAKVGFVMNSARRRMGNNNI